jgi:hypothetical protein
LLRAFEHAVDMGPKKAMEMGSAASLRLEPVRAAAVGDNGECGITFLDAYPDMVRNGAVVVNGSDANTARPVVRIAADGVARVVLRIPAADGDVFTVQVSDTPRLERVPRVDTAVLGGLYAIGSTDKSLSLTLPDVTAK